MPGEDQERFEDYLELERFIAEIQAGHAAHPPQELTPTQARVYRLAMLFHAATPEVGEPDAEFAAQLHIRLEKELQALKQDSPPVGPTPTGIPATTPLPTIPKHKRRLPRRLLLAGSVSVAASLAVGVAGEHMVDMAMLHRTSQEVTIKLASPMDWFPVTTVAEMGNQAVKFKTEDQSGSVSLTGYVVRSDSTEKGQIIAMSAACTHKGCIVAWSGEDRRFHCPCHGGIFSENGGIDASSSSLYLSPLPRLDVKVDTDGKIYVRMPASA